MQSAPVILCPFCGRETPLDYVHGHAQCIHCKNNHTPCCDGATCDDYLEDGGANNISKSEVEPEKK